jgi:molybdopterin molybdotransferase
MANKLRDDCFRHDEKRLRHVEALNILRTRLAPVTNGECIRLAHAAGRVLGEAAVAARPVPAHTNAAVDGYSFAFAAYDAREGCKLPVEGRAAAGHPLVSQPSPGVAVRIFTGAVIPDGHDTVVMQEDVSIREQQEGCTHVAIPAGLKRGSNVRQAGEDVKAGEIVVDAGAVLRPQDLAALASIGMTEVTCFRRLAVAIISTGDEVVTIGGGEIGFGAVHDANAPMLVPLIAAAGAEATYLGVLGDNREAVRQMLAASARRFDVIITTGGASRGEEDHVVAALDQLGERHIWQLAIKPGRPMSFGQIGSCVLVGLPGNPVAVFVCFLLYVWPMLRRMGGAPWPEPRRYRLPAAFAYPGRKIGRREFWRGTLMETPSGLAVDKFARDGSGLISGLRAADGLIEIAEDIAEVRRGDLVSFIPFTEFGIPGR